MTYSTNITWISWMKHLISPKHRRFHGYFANAICDMSRILVIGILVVSFDVPQIERSHVSLHNKWRSPLKISSVNVIKFAVFWGFGHIYFRNPKWKTSFSVRCISLNTWRHCIQILTSVVLYVRLTGQYLFFYKTYFKPEIHKTITSN